MRAIAEGMSWCIRSPLVMRKKQIETGYDNNDDDDDKTSELFTFDMQEDAPVASFRPELLAYPIRKINSVPVVPSAIY